MNFETSNGVSHVNQDFLWMVDYLDGKSLCEYDLLTTQRNDFYKINKSMIDKFGLIGHGMKLYVDSNTGMLNLNGLQLLFSYMVGDKEYSLTGFGNGFYTDIISYKDAYTDADIVNPNQQYSSHIHTYNFGFKKKLVFGDGTEFALQIVCAIPRNRPAYLDIKIVSNQDLDGNLYIKKVGRIAESIPAPLKSGHAGICEWQVN